MTRNRASGLSAAWKNRARYQDAMMRVLRRWLGHRIFFRTCALALVMSAGGWLTTYAIPPDHLTAHDYRDARRFAYGAVAFAKRGGVAAPDDALYERAYALALEGARWRTRSLMQDNVGNFFLVAAALLAVSYWINPRNTRWPAGDASAPAGPHQNSCP